MDCVKAIQKWGTRDLVENEKIEELSKNKQNKLTG